MSTRFGRTAETPATGLASAYPAATASAPDATDDLRRQRDRLARELAERQSDLGGLTYEMAARDHFRLDVLVRKAAELQRVDGELREVERILALGDAAATGDCPACGALHSANAGFCWQCGVQLMATTRVPG